MRTGFILLLLSFSNSLLSQNNFARQLKEVLKDTSNCFRSFKSDFIEAAVFEGIIDSTFKTKITIEGTDSNYLFISERHCMIVGRIDSVKEKRGRKIIDEWKEKISSILGAGFYSSEKEITPYNPSKYGWILERGNVSIDLSLFPHGIGASIYWVDISVSITNFEALMKKTE